MKLHRSQLVNITDFARDEIKNTIKSPHETHDEYLARCWVAALLRVIAKDNQKVYIEDEELEV